eukprot:6037078-Amphidinium_carterae.2
MKTLTKTAIFPVGHCPRGGCETRRCVRDRQAPTKGKKTTQIKKGKSHRKPLRAQCSTKARKISEGKWQPSTGACGQEALDSNLTATEEFQCRDE